MWYIYIYICVCVYIYLCMYTCEQDDKCVATKLDWLSDADVASLICPCMKNMIRQLFMQVFVAKVVDSYIYYRAWALLGVVVGYPKQIAAWLKHAVLGVVLEVNHSVDPLKTSPQTHFWCIWSHNPCSLADLFFWCIFWRTAMLTYDLRKKNIVWDVQAEVTSMLFWGNVYGVGNVKSSPFTAVLTDIFMTTVDCVVGLLAGSVPKWRDAGRKKTWTSEQNIIIWGYDEIYYKTYQLT